MKIQPASENHPLARPMAQLVNVKLSKTRKKHDKPNPGLVAIWGNSLYMFRIACQLLFVIIKIILITVNGEFNFDFNGPC